jgi:superfamily II DNA or RNA helicase
LITIYGLNNLIGYVPIQTGLYTLIVIDEIHRLVNTNHLKTLNVLGKFRLGLLGVMPDGNAKRKIEDFAPIIDTITEKEAIENNWIANYVEYNLELELTNDDKVIYANYTSHMKDMITQFANLHKQYTSGNILIFESEFDLILACYTGKHWNKQYIPSHILRESVAKLNGWHIELDMSNPNDVEIDNKWNPAKLYDKCKTLKEVVTDVKRVIEKDSGFGSSPVIPGIPKIPDMQLA